VDRQNAERRKGDGQNDIESVIGKSPLDWPVERLFVYALVRAMKPYTVLELGVSDGIGAVVICRALTENARGKYCGVDDWSHEYGGRSDGRKVPRENTVRDGSSPEIMAFKTCDSLEYLKAQKDKTWGLVIVDANHSYESALADIREARRVAREIVLVHDMGTEPGVTKACLAQDVPGVYIPSSRGYWMWSAPCE